MRLSRPDARQFVRLAVLGCFGIFFYNLCFFYGLHYINASRASLIVALNPAVIGVASWWLFKERLGAAKWLGIAQSPTAAGRSQRVGRRFTDLRLRGGVGRVLIVFP